MQVVFQQLYLFPRKTWITECVEREEWREGKAEKRGGGEDETRPRRPQSLARSPARISRPLVEGPRFPCEWGKRPGCGTPHTNARHPDALIRQRPGPNCPLFCSCHETWSEPDAFRCSLSSRNVGFRTSIPSSRPIATVRSLGVSDAVANARVSP